MKKNSRFWFIPAELFLLMAMIICAVNFSGSVYLQKMIKEGVTADAEIVRVGTHSSGRYSSTYVTYYEYTDENGIRYSGRAHSYIHDINEAESYLGTKIKIYIDGKGKSIWVEQTPTRPWEAAIMIAVLSAGFIGILVGVIVCRIRFNRKKSAEATAKCSETTENVEDKKN